MNSIEDELFGLLQWNTEYQEWIGHTIILPYGETEVELPAEYVDSHELREHIHETMKIIKRDELSFRQRAANELFADGEYLFFWDENQQFDHNQFVNEMSLVIITFTDFANIPFELHYEYGEEGMEQGIIIHLTWDGVYSDARIT